MIGGRLKMKKDTIFINIASYRDPELGLTVKDCYEKSKNPENLFFSVVSDANDYEHSYLSFIPTSQISYIKRNTSEASGVCSARSLAMVGSSEFEYVLLIDSHSRFMKFWDEDILGMYKKSQSFYGKKIIITNFPPGYGIDEYTKKYVFDNNKKITSVSPMYDEINKILVSKINQNYIQENTEYGDEHFAFVGCSTFMSSYVSNLIPYDPNVYFFGEEPSMSLRAYTLGIKSIVPTKNYMYTRYKMESDGVDSVNNWHGRDIGHENRFLLEKMSNARLKMVFQGDKSLGVFGIGSTDLWSEWQSLTGIDLMSLDFDR